MQLKVIEALKKDFRRFQKIASTSPSKHYRVYKIPKRKFGFRVIAQPTPELKNIQRRIVSILSKHTKVHESAFAYIEGKGIKDNAKVHLKSNYLLKMDLESFFNSITPEMFFNALNSQGVSIPKEDRNLISELTFWNRSKKLDSQLVLSVGAPSSPFISNLVMYDFDCEVKSICDQYNVNYSRYADDLTFSTAYKGVLFEIESIVKRVLKDKFGSDMTINSLKTVYSSKAHNRHVTGITLTNNNKLSLGRDRKRYISALVHKFKCGELDDLYDVQELKGLIGFSLYVEPEFVMKIKKKYGEGILSEINKSVSGGIYETE